MTKIVISSILLLFSSLVFSEASVDVQNKSKTFLFSAPGTVTGSDINSQGNVNSVLPTIPENNSDQRQRRMRYKYVGESKKFRQFGQKSGQNNPWAQEYSAKYRRNLSPLNVAPTTNPWQLGGMPPLTGMTGGQSDAYSNYNYNSPQYGSGNYSGNNGLFPDFPVGIYRDTNPTGFPMPENMNGFMPGFGGDKFDLPFSPFGMF